MMRFSVACFSFFHQAICVHHNMLCKYVTADLLARPNFLRIGSSPEDVSAAVLFLMDGQNLSLKDMSFFL